MNILEEMADGLKLKESTKVVRRTAWRAGCRQKTSIHLPRRQEGPLATRSICSIERQMGRSLEGSHGIVNART